MTVYEIIISIASLVPAYIGAIVALLRYRSDKKRNERNEK